MQVDSLQLVLMRSVFVITQSKFLNLDNHRPKTKIFIPELCAFRVSVFSCAENTWPFVPQKNKHINIKSPKIKRLNLGRLNPLRSVWFFDIGEWTSKRLLAICNRYRELRSGDPQRGNKTGCAPSLIPFAIETSTIRNLPGFLLLLGIIHLFCGCVTLSNRDENHAQKHNSLSSTSILFAVHMYFGRNVSSL